MFYDRFLELCDKKGIKPTNACIEAGLSRGLAAKWKATGTEKPSADALEKMSAYFGVSIDEILGVQKETAPTLTKKDERDIEKRLEAVLEDLENAQGGLAFSGEPLDEVTRELLAESLRNSMRIGKTLAKQKYTPKKYRKD